MGDSTEQLVFINQFAAKRHFLTRLASMSAMDRSDAEMERLDFNFEYFPREEQECAKYPFLWWKKLIARDGGYLLFYNPGFVNAQWDKELFYPILSGFMPHPTQSRIVFAPKTDNAAPSRQTIVPSA